MSSYTSRAVICGVPFDLVSLDDAVQCVIDWRRIGKRGYVTFSNPHSVLECTRDPQMGSATLNSALILPDGVGIVLAARLLGVKHHGRVPGPDFMLALMNAGREAGLRHYLFGGKPGLASVLADRLREAYPGVQIVGASSPPFRRSTDEEDRAIVDALNGLDADVVWVGLGAPKQEKWMAEHRDRLTATALVGVGAAFDFHSGAVRRAPRWIQKVGVEWAHRLFVEPRRMLKRNVDSFTFLARVVAQRASGGATARGEGRGER